MSFVIVGLDTVNAEGAKAAENAKKKPEL